jgi:hypothetical protein
MASLQAPRSITRQVSCQIQLKICGWWVTFEDPQAGLLLDTNSKKLQFLIDCGIQVIEPDLDRFLSQVKITECPIEYYDRATQFPLTPF